MYICISLFTEIFSAAKPRSRNRARSLGGVLGRPGDVLGASWARLGAVLGPSWGRLGNLGASWERPGAVLKRLGDVLGRISLPIQLESDF